MARSMPTLYNASKVQLQLQAKLQVVLGMQAALDSLKDFNLPPARYGAAFPNADKLRESGRLMSADVVPQEGESEARKIGASFPWRPIQLAPVLSQQLSEPESENSSSRGSSPAGDEEDWAKRMGS